MKRSLWLCLIAFLLFALGNPAAGRAEVNVSVGVKVGVPPPLVIPSPPAVYLIPGTYVYFAPDVEVDFFFYQGYWYRPHGGYWYRARHYGGPWVHIVTAKVPRVLISLPPGFRHVPAGHQRIPHGQLKKHWKVWERDRYWDSHERWEDFKEGRRERGERRKERRHKDD